MNSFLHKVCRNIVETQGEDLAQSLIVTPNRRIGEHINHCFASLDIIQIPESKTINDWLFSLSQFKPVDELMLPFDLYAIHLEIELEPKSFDDFLPVAKLMMADFNEIDLNMVDAESLFNYISELKAIKLWNPEGDELTDFQRKYLSQYRRLALYYKRLQENLSSQKQAYTGMAYRFVAENIQHICDNIGYKKIFFVGFNAISKSEKQILKTLENNAIAVFYWDADQYYMDDKVQEAGFYLRYLKDVFNSPFNFIEDNFSGKKIINITGVSKNVGQALACKQLLDEELLQFNQDKKTVVVLANEELLQSLLFVLPEKKSDININIGESIKHTVLTDIFCSLIELHETKNEWKHLNAKGEQCFYTPDIIKLLENSYLQNIFKNIDFYKLLDKIVKTNKVFFAETEIVEIVKEENFVILFKSLSQPSELIVLMQLFIDRILVNIHNVSERCIAESIADIIKQLSVLANGIEKNTLKEFKTLRRLFVDLTAVSTLPGMINNNMGKIQIMNLHETKALDFDHVIILSANEGVLPPKKTDTSFIPFDVRRDFGLPGSYEKDAVFAYHFYRLLQRAEKIDIFYNTDNDQLSGNDKSRFVYQIIYELKQKNPEIIVNESFFLSKPLLKQENLPLCIHKDKEILKTLKSFFQHHHLSASVINKYISCKLKFYFSKIKGLAEQDEIEETIDAKTLGTVVHESLQHIYNEKIGQRLSKEWIAAISNENIETIIKTALNKNFENGNIDYGKNLMILKIAETFLKQLINKEKEIIANNHSIDIVALEKDFETTLTVNDVDFKIVAYIDRVDIFDNVLRIIDYKTGNVDCKKDLSPPELDELMKNPAYAKAFQLFLYAWIYQKTYSENKLPLEPAIISLKKIKNYVYPATVEGMALWDENSFESYENALKSLLFEIIDPDVPFSQTDDLTQCEYCEFKNICMR